jgi:hypothetical protein
MLLKVKLFLAGIIVYFYKVSYLKKYRHFIKSQSKKEHLYIFDLDNTLADTFPYLHIVDTDEMYRTIPPFQNMLEIAFNVFSSNFPCIILTARDYNYKSATEFWIDKNIKVKDIPLFIVPKASDKIAYLKLANNNFKNVTYYDDLSYNHENGDVKFYSKEIETFQNMTIEYIGYEEILKINNK